MGTFHAATDLSTKEIVWVQSVNGTQRNSHNRDRQFDGVAAFEIAGLFRDIYASDLI